MCTVISKHLGIFSLLASLYILPVIPTPCTQHITYSSLIRHDSVCNIFLRSGQRTQIPKGRRKLENNILVGYSLLY